MTTDHPDYCWVGIPVCRAPDGSLYQMDESRLCSAFLTDILAGVREMPLVSFCVLALYAVHRSGDVVIAEVIDASGHHVPGRSYNPASRWSPALLVRARECMQDYFAKAAERRRREAERDLRS